MPKIKKIKPAKPRGRFAIVAARFNTEIVEGLLVGALKALNKHGVSEKAIDIVRVPGSLELALAAQRLGANKKYVAVICLGAVIQGDTDHYDYVCTGTVNGITQAGLCTGVPTIFGVLTCRKMKHARERSSDNSDNKGYDAALAAIEMAGLMQTTK
jgi:6,7-dimethyl-8-ribityllumazine synthase